MNDKPRPRRFVILDVIGNPVAEIDLTGIPNADARAVMTWKIEDRCDKGFWHETQAGQFVPWGSD